MPERNSASASAVRGQTALHSHGAKLEGQGRQVVAIAEWGRLPAPPHDASGHTWHHPDDVLIDCILNGLKPHAGKYYASDMPAFADILTREDAAEVLTFFKSSWPERERAHQQRLTDRHEVNRGTSVNTQD